LTAAVGNGEELPGMQEAAHALERNAIAIAKRQRLIVLDYNN
jgi:hypothetical protein